MPNRFYRRSADKERDWVKKGQDLGYYATRTPGSKSPVDVLWIKPAEGCYNPDHYEVLFHQHKVLDDAKKEEHTIKLLTLPTFDINIQWHVFPGRKKKGGK